MGKRNGSSANRPEVGTDLGTITGTVKDWLDRGFGFIRPDKGQGVTDDIFILSGTFKAHDRLFWRNYAKKGSRVTCKVEMAEKGPLAIEVVEMDVADENAAVASTAITDTTPIPVTVKFFNAAKGFGFAEREEGGSDIFIHISAVEKSGIRPDLLTEGRKARILGTVTRGRKPEAVSLELVA